MPDHDSVQQLDTLDSDSLQMGLGMALLKNGPIDFTADEVQQLRGKAFLVGHQHGEDEPCRLSITLVDADAPIPSSGTDRIQ